MLLFSFSSFYCLGFCLEIADGDMMLRTILGYIEGCVGLFSELLAVVFSLERFMNCMRALLLWER